jgi:uncharacterized protein (DUF1697 family)
VVATTTPGERWVALLRGVNVGGITVRSADLAMMMTGLGYTDVKTVLASGNVLFTADGTSPGSATDANGLKRDIEQALADTFGYEAWIVLSSQGALQTVVDDYPWEETPELQPYVMFGSEQSSLDELLAFTKTLDDQPDRVQEGHGVLYWEVPKGMSVDTAFAKESAKKRYKATTTTRNVRTLRKLLP